VSYHISLVRFKQSPSHPTSPIPLSPTATLFGSVFMCLYVRLSTVNRRHCICHSYIIQPSLRTVSMRVSPYEHNQGKRPPCFSLRFLIDPKPEAGFRHSKTVSRFGVYVQISMSTFFLSLLSFLSTFGI